MVFILERSIRCRYFHVADMWIRRVSIAFYLFLQYGWASDNLKQHQINGLTEGQNDKYLINCVVNLAQIVNIYAPTILILEDRKDDGDCTITDKMIETFAENNLPIAVQDSNNYHVNQSQYVFDRYVVVIVHLKLKQLIDFKINSNDKRIKYLIIISENTKNSISLLLKFGRRYLHNDITFVIPNGYNHRIETFIQEIDEKKCRVKEDIEPQQINVCSAGSLKTNVVFLLDRRVNFKKCPFRVGMAAMYPFSIIPNEDELKNYDLTDQIKGSDVEIMKIIANSFNATPEWHYIKREVQNPYITLDYVNLIVNGSLHAAAGGLYHIFGDVVSYSGIYTRQAAIWIYTIDRKSRSWRNLVNKLDGVYVFFIFYISYSSLSFLFRKYNYERPDAGDIFFYSWGALLGLASLQQTRSLKNKILDIFYLILSIYLASYMNIQLFSFLTVDGPSTIFKTNDEVIGSGRIAYLNPKTKYFIQEEKYLEFAGKSEDCGSFDDCHLKTLQLKGLTVTLDQFFDRLQATTAVNDEARILRATQNLVTVYQEMLTKKDSVFVIGLQKIITRLFEAGICKQLFKEAIGLTVIGKAEIANKNAVSNSYTCQSGCAITLSQVAGVFYVWIIGTLLSICVFVLELSWNKQLLYKHK